MARKDVIVIGGSAGSGAVLKRILADLPGDFPGSIFITSGSSRFRIIRYCPSGDQFG